MDRARFTWIGPSVLRLEWAEDGVFEDRASVVALHRRVAPPEWRARDEGPWTVIETGSVRLRYRAEDGRFESGNLEVEAEREGRVVRWRPGMEPGGNLGGTVRTLDGVGGRIDLGSGLLSRDGWVLLDDSVTPLLSEEDPPRAVARPGGDRLDWYLFLHGTDYRAALADYALVGGPPPMPPRYAFGLWWSRYWAYTDTELMELVLDFERHGLPLDVLVVDMDWHETFELRWGRGERDAAGQRKGWTGHTWNRTYFPDPEAFLGWVRERGIRTTLNLHPASGIQPWEERYRDVARGMDIDPRAEEWVPFRIEDPDFARVYLERVIHPLERQGVDFWWLDWQQWERTDVPGLTPTMWLGHVFFTDMERSGRGRPMILHRFGGLGSHRHPGGFSGDAASTWEALALEPELTATAANVLFGYWSHDIGGHEPGPVSAELYARWIQFGALSPILRTHATRHPDAERRIWAFPPDAARAMREAVLLRTRLLPYLYGAAREAYETGVAVVRPLYYAWPDLEEAYAFPDQYLLGPDLLVAPVTAPADPATGLARKVIWIPPGSWIEWGSGEVLPGGRTLVRRYTLDEIPLFVRAGSVIPCTRAGARAGDPVVDPLVLAAFPGADGGASLYEDAGDDQGYRHGAFRRTAVQARWTGGGRRLR
ncbi:MAG TPA: TIM-barrel domain-containing protein, partial [Longimicrobiales bacterium]|nr:TIM-barrel domain-containing protein [Longimicrobiales bacterium]